MKRALIVGASTVTGLAAVLLLNPDSPPIPTAQVQTPAQSSTTEPGSDTAASQTPAPSASQSTAPTGTDSGSSASDPTADSTDSTGTSAAGTSGTYSGDAVQVRNFGIMQVQVTVSDGRVTDVTSLQVPDWDHKSQQINSYAVPELQASALTVQSSDVSYVSGATFTSMAFAESLQSALAKAGLG